MERNSFSVLIAGGGVAALEAALTLRELGEGRIRVELLAPEPSFWYRPVAVAEPFDLGEVRHFDLGQLADGIGAFVTRIGGFRLGCGRGFGRHYCSLGATNGSNGRSGQRARNTFTTEWQRTKSPIHM